MGLRDRFLSRGTLAASPLTPPRRPSFLKSAASRIRLDDKQAKPIRTTARQARAWFMYDEIPFLSAAYNLQADQVARVPFFPALLLPGDSDPIPLQAIMDKDEGTDEIEVPLGLTQAVVDECDRLLTGCRAREGGVPETRRRLTLNLRVPGECYGLWTEDDDGRTFMRVLSTDELHHYGGDRWGVIPSPGARPVRIDNEKSSLSRIYRSHPRYGMAADSAMLRMLNTMEEWVTLSQGNRSLLESRIASVGVLLVNSGLDWGSMNETDDDDPEALSPFTNALVTSAMTAMQDPASMAAHVPIVAEVEVPGDGNLANAMHHVTMERPMREAELKRGAELVIELVRGADVIPESVFGLGEAATFATGRQITADKYNDYIDPIVLTEADALTSVWLRPGLLLAGVDPALVEQITFWRDPSAIIAQPDMAKNAVDLLDRGELSGESGRRALGFTEADAPDDDERAAFAARNTKAVGTGDATGPNAGDRLLASAIPVHSREVLAIGPSPLDTLGRRLGDIDRVLMAQLAVAADNAVTKQLRTIGARLRSRAQGNTATKALLDGVSNLDVGRTLGRGMLTVLNVDLDAEVNSETFGELHANYDAWVQQAQRRSTSMVLALADDPPDRTEIDARQDDDRHAGWLLLAGFLVTLTHDRVFDPTTTAPLGEFDPTLSVPMGGIRDSLARAGGSLAPPSKAVDVDPVGEIGTGVNTRDLITSVLRAKLTGWTWNVGSPGVPFEPHSDLDGVDFDSWQSDVLAWDEGEFPFVPFLRPSDHFSCQCSFSLRLGPDA